MQKRASDKTGRGRPRQLSPAPLLPTKPGWRRGLMCQPGFVGKSGAGESWRGRPLPVLSLARFSFPHYTALELAPLPKACETINISQYSMGGLLLYSVSEWVMAGPPCCIVKCLLFHMP
jgi:hypothetical protein